VRYGCSFAGRLAMAILLSTVVAWSTKGGQDREADPSLLVDARSGIGDPSTGDNWPSYGSTYNEDHESPLADINDGNIAKLGLVSTTDLADVPGAATVPLAVDGVVYLAIGPSIVHAVDAVSGKLLWQYDPGVYAVAGRKMRSAWGTRGLAYWKGRLYVGTYDGRLIAIDAETGKPVWSVQTTSADDNNYITGAPRAFRGLILIGNGGADSGYARGYVTAYDAQTGAQKWRTFLVPGDPANGFENDALELAAKTWTGQWWKFGGGGNAWGAMTYDAEQNVVYIGTGNGAPWNRKIRSPGGSDNLFVSSILALDADTGAYKWHYQVNPGDTWDYDTTMDIELATLIIDGKSRKVLMTAAKNGFFYVIDRTNGTLISAEKFSKVTWAKRIDLKTGRPVEEPGIRYENEPITIYPGPIGAHSWMPMSFDRKDGLAFIPTTTLPGYYSDKTLHPSTWKVGKGFVNLGVDPPVGAAQAGSGSSSLLAWDPVHQKKAWEVTTPAIWNGGTMTTAGNLVFQGQIDGTFNAYAADRGKKLWSFDTGLGIGGAPITFRAKGKQYIALVVGFGGSGVGFPGAAAGQYGWNARAIKQRLFLFALDGKMPPPPSQATPRPVSLDDPAMKLDTTLVAEGGKIFSMNCAACHGGGAVSAGYAPDLRASHMRLDADGFAAVVKDGLLLERGMPKFGELNDRELLTLRQFVTSRAREDLGEGQ
jgi:quinohemoprotein ethanol dehydrogenase